MKELTHNIILDIFLWAFLGILFALQLLEVNNPPLDVHEWRQTYTLGVATNYYENNTSFLYPRQIVCDSRQGIIGQEFPLLNQSIAVGWKFFGKKNWVFRLITSLVFLLGIWYFYSTIKLLGTPNTAFISAVILGSSLLFKYANKAMPDAFGVSLVLIALFFGVSYLKKGSWKYLLFWFFFLTIGVLSKLPSSIVACIIAVPLLNESLDKTKKIYLIGSSMVSVAIIALWYFYWVPYLSGIEGFKLYYPTTLSQGWIELIENSESLSEKLINNIFLQPITSWLVLVGLGAMFVKKKRDIIAATLLTLVMTIYFILKSGKIFCTHEYYLLPLIPMLSVIVSLPFATSKKLPAFFTCILGIVLAIYSLKLQSWDLKILWENEKYIRLERIVDAHIPKHSKILTNDLMNSPRLMYMCGRKGWNDERYFDRSWVLGEKNVGLEYLVLDKSRITTDPCFPVVFEDKDFVIQKVEED